MNQSAGFVIIQNNKILLAHPTGSKWIGTYTIPKGKVEDNESFLEAAIRETKEEIGIVITDKPKFSGTIEYKKFGKVYKLIHFFVVFPEKEIKIKKIQQEEVDWAGFLTKQEASNKIFWRMRKVLSFL